MKEVPLRGVSTVVVCGVLLGLLAAPPISADTVHLKSGGQIKDCRVVRRDSRYLHIRTPAGTMGVPHDAIDTVEEAKSIFDTFDEKRAKTSDTDPKALYELARWCREKGGLRPEMEELLEKVIETSPDHTGARHALNYVLVGSTWTLAPPMKISLAITRGDEHAADLRKQLGIVFKDRKDIALAEDGESSGTEGSFDATFEVTIRAFINNGSSFFGQRIRGSTSRATVNIGAKAPWIGTAALPLVLEGETPASVPNPASQAVTDCVQRNLKSLDDFLYRITQLRLLRMEQAQRPAARGG